MGKDREMVDFKKVDELREKEAEVRKGLLAKFRAVDRAVWIGICVGVGLLMIVILALASKG
jgi:hypothetical protein